MRLDITKEEKRKLGKMIKGLRLDADLTQLQLVKMSRFPTSTRSLISLEKGNLIRNDEVYDALLEVFALSHCYDEKVLERLHQMVKEIFQAYCDYDVMAYHRLCWDLISQFDCECDYVEVQFTVEAVKCIADLFTSKECISRKEFFFLYFNFDCFHDELKMIIGDALFMHEYQHNHDNATLADIYELVHSLNDCLYTRFCIVSILYLVDKRKDYLNAYLLLLRLEKAEAKRNNENEHVHFAILQWKANIEVFILPLSFEERIEQCEQLIEQHCFSTKELVRYYNNTSGGFYQLKNYEKARDYLKKSLQLPNEFLLPQLIWYYNMHYYVDKTLPMYRAVDVSNCSEQLQVCWHYFVLKQTGADACTLENYIIKTLLPYLKNLSSEFAKVYFMQLSDLVKETRNYKKLSIYVDKLSFLTFI